MVILIPDHKDNNPYVLIIDRNASKVFLYAFLPFDIDACLLIKATSNGLPTNAPNAPLMKEIPTFYSFFNFLSFFSNF